MTDGGRPRAAAPPLRFDDVDFAHDAEPTLTGVSLDVHAGEVVALVGPSGAGKTTLLGLANGTLVPEAGRVLLDGVDLATLGGRARRAALARVGTVPQHVPLPGNLRVVHNVLSGRLGGWGLGRSVRSLLAPVELDEARAALARLGIADLLEARTDSLSGGQQQRVAVARALVGRPSLVLADEPVSAVDPSWSAEVVAAFVALAREQGTAVLVSLHDPDLARGHADRIVALRHGAVVLDAPPSAVDDDALAAVYDLGDARPT